MGSNAALLPICICLLMQAYSDAVHTENRSKRQITRIAGDAPIERPIEKDAPIEGPDGQPIIETSRPRPTNGGDPIDATGMIADDDYYKLYKQIQDAAATLARVKGIYVEGDILMTTDGFLEHYKLKPLHELLPGSDELIWLHPGQVHSVKQDDGAILTVEGYEKVRDQVLKARPPTPPAETTTNAGTGNSGSTATTVSKCLIMLAIVIRGVL